MKVVMIAPMIDGAPQYSPDEVAVVTNALHPELLAGHITPSDIGRALREPCDLLWIAAHGSDAGVDLGGTFIAADRLVQYLRRYKPAVFLNTCDSDRLAIEINSATGAPVIFNVGQVGDEEAAVTGALLAQHLADGSSLRQAYTLSRPENSTTYRMIGAHGRTEQQSISELLDVFARRVEIQIDDVERRFNRRLDEIEDDMGKRFDHLEAQARKPIFTRENAINWSLAYIVFASTIPLTFYDIRQAFDMSPAAALIVIGLLVVLAFGLFVRGLGFTFWL